MKRAELPSFGNLNGIRVVTTGTNIAGPVAATSWRSRAPK